VLVAWELCQCFWRGGVPREALQLVPCSGAVGGSKLVCVVGTGPADLRAQACFPTTTPAATLARAVDFFRGHVRPAPPAALGIASFGPLDLDPASHTSGWITETPKPGWSRVDLAGTFRRALGVPVALDTDADGAALGEQQWGAGAGFDPVVYVTVGTGIGGGAVVGGRRLHGLVHPEMGHVRVPRDGADTFRGTCPFHGDCLEGLASGVAIRERCGAPGEALAIDHPVWALEARYLALGLVNVIAVLSPQRIIVGGGVMRHPRLLARIRAEVKTLLGGYVRVPVVTDAIDDYIVPPALGERAGVLGALALARGLACL
jgi:fructokinase